MSLTPAHDYLTDMTYDLFLDRRVPAWVPALYPLVRGVDPANRERDNVARSMGCGALAPDEGMPLYPHQLARLVTQREHERRRKP